MKGRKTGGRVKGTPNKHTKEIREKLKSVLDREIENLPQLLSSLPDKERIDLLIKLMPFVLPKIEMIKMYDGEVSDGSHPFSWEEKMTE